MEVLLARLLQIKHARTQPASTASHLSMKNIIAQQIHSPGEKSANLLLCSTGKLLPSPKPPNPFYCFQEAPQDRQQCPNGVSTKETQPCVLH